MGKGANEKTAVVSFRVREYERHLLQAAAARRDVFLSDWLREATLDALRQELEAERGEGAA